ncbi:MAG: response regulator transcription factor [Flavonifractor plautii]
MWISVLEDEAVLNNLITKYLQKEGYSVRSYLRGEDAVQGLDKPTDLWVIDIMLPDIDGFTVFREVQRKNPNSYVIFISARNQDIDRLAGLELGGDDYISKPFLVRELVIKVQRLLKGGRPKTAEVQVGPYTVHLEKHLVYCGGESISLTVKEYDLLLYLAANRGHVLKRGDILDAVWGYTFYGSDRVVDDTIRRLRKKLPGIEISTLYGLGYCLTGRGMNRFATRYWLQDWPLSVQLWACLSLAEGLHFGRHPAVRPPPASAGGARTVVWAGRPVPPAAHCKPVRRQAGGPAHYRAPGAAGRESGAHQGQKLE